MTFGTKYIDIINNKKIITHNYEEYQIGTIQL